MFVPTKHRTHTHVDVIQIFVDRNANFLADSFYSWIGYVMPKVEDQLTRIMSIISSASSIAFVLIKNETASAHDNSNDDKSYHHQNDMRVELLIHLIAISFKISVRLFPIFIEISREVFMLLARYFKLPFKVVVSIKKIRTHFKGDLFSSNDDETLS